MGRATITHDGSATTYAMLRATPLILGSLTMIAFAWLLMGVLARYDMDPAVLWTWVFPVIVTIGVLPIILNAVRPQMVRIDDEGIEARRWSGVRRMLWREMTEVRSYSNREDLFLRLRDGRGRILLSTRWFGWDAEDIRAIARRIEAQLEAHHAHVDRPESLDRFPSWSSPEAGLVERTPPGSHR